MPSFFSGKEGSATLNGVNVYTSKWRFRSDRDTHDTTYVVGSANDALAWRDFISGYKRGGIELEGPYDPTVALPFNSASCTFNLLLGSTYTVGGTTATGPIEIVHDVNGAARWTFSGKLKGAPTLNVATS